MGADTKKLRNRIKSVNSTLHLTKAMGLVASSKIRRATNAMAKSREYADALGQMIRRLASSPECRKSPYMSIRDGNRTRLIVVAGDRGLAGGYNANIFRAAREFSQADIIPIGKRAFDRYGGENIGAESFSLAEAFSLAKSLCHDFAAGSYDRLGILCTKYVSMMTQEPQIKWILPLSKESDARAKTFVYEPDEITILESAVTEYVAGTLVVAVRESFACEVASRRNAMDSAGKNAQQMIDDLGLAYNRARQSAITQEITEIIAGSDS